MSPSPRALGAVVVVCALSALSWPEPAPVISVTQVNPEPEQATLSISLLPATEPPIPVSFAGAAPGLTYYEARLDPKRGGHVRGPDGVEISIPPDIIVDSMGAAVTEPIAVRWALLDEVEHVHAPPGRLTTPVEGRELPMQSFGMVDFSIWRDNEALQLNGMAALSFPVRPEFTRLLDDIGVYWLDEDLGTWERAAATPPIGGRLNVSANRTGWWNCDAPLMRRGCVRAVFDGDVSDKTFGRLTGTEWMTAAGAFVDDSGGMCVDGPPDMGAVLEGYERGDANTCVAWKSASVTTSAGGNSCFDAASTCTEVVLRRTEGPCRKNVAQRKQSRAAGSDRVTFVIPGQGVGSVRVGPEMAADPAFDLWLSSLGDKRVDRRPTEALKATGIQHEAAMSRLRRALGPFTQPNQPVVELAAAALEDLERPADSGPMVVMVPSGVRSVGLRCPNGQRQTAMVEAGQAIFEGVPTGYPCVITLPELGSQWVGGKGAHGYGCNASGCSQEW